MKDNSKLVGFAVSHPKTVTILMLAVTLALLAAAAPTERDAFATGLWRSSDFLAGGDFESAEQVEAWLDSPMAATDCALCPHVGFLLSRRGPNQVTQLEHLLGGNASWVPRAHRPAAWEGAGFWFGERAGHQRSTILDLAGELPEAERAAFLRGVEIGRAAGIWQVEVVHECAPALVP